MENKPDLSFPLKIFPTDLADIILELHYTRNYPVNYTAAAMFFAFSVAIGNSRYAFFNDIRVINVYYLCLLGSAGSAKSYPISFALKPLADLNLQYLGNYERELQEYRQLPPEQRTNKPKAKQLIVKDFTIEALAKVLKDNPRGICVSLDEFKQWLSQFNRYRGSGADTEQWLSMFNGEAIICNRKTTDDIVCVPETCVSVIGGLQPGLLNKLFAGEYTDNGLLQRILFVNNESDKDPLLWPLIDDLPSGSSDIYRELLLKVYHKCESGNPQCFKFSQRAVSALVTWQNAKECALSVSGDDAEVAIFRKIQIYALRFCIVIHSIRYANNEDEESVEIDENTAKAAISLAEYFFGNARYVSNYIADGGDDPRPFFKVLDRLDHNFTSREAVQIGAMLHISRRSIFRYLDTSKQYVKKICQGNYQKIE